MDINKRIVVKDDDNIDALRSRYPDGLRFVVGDTHGEVATLQALMEKIKFDPEKDHIYFVGDYNAGGYVQQLLRYMATYYEADCDAAGFHMIRGNHERELNPTYTLENLPDIIVIRGKLLNYYIVHAGMVSKAFELINKDMAKNPQQAVFSYKLDDVCVQYDAPLRQIMWSRNGLYSQKSYWHSWPDEAELLKNRACIIHGHSPYCFFKHEDYLSYGDENLFWQKQHIFFSEDLQSFNIDSNVKGRFQNGEGYRGISCVCLEGIEELVAKNDGWLTSEGVKNAENFVFSADYVYNSFTSCCGDLGEITGARPDMKLITLDAGGNPVIAE
ncbi:MAG: metallophosphoesterase [Oscillospiraceae bacterium]|nr:metallophosphoesterase [Oscillospiraceae bacterium]